MKIYVWMALLSFAITVALCPILIPILHRLKFGQPILEDAPDAHKKKQGTPTMGGVTFILGAAIAAGAFFMILPGNATLTLSVLVCALFFGIIGIADDLIKITKKHNEGLTAKQKFGAQAAVPIALMISLYPNKPLAPRLCRFCAPCHGKQRESHRWLRRLGIHHLSHCFGLFCLPLLSFGRGRCVRILDRPVGRSRRIFNF